MALCGPLQKITAGSQPGLSVMQVLIYEWLIQPRAAEVCASPDPIKRTTVDVSYVRPGFVKPTTQLLH